MTAHFEAKKHAYRQTQDGIVVSFVVHPNDMTPELATAALGTRYMVAFSEIGDDGKPKRDDATVLKAYNEAMDGPHRHPKPEKKPSKPFHTLPLSQQIALRCNDPAFQKFLGVGNADMAAEEVRRRCEVKSRADIASHPLAHALWDNIDINFGAYLVDQQYADSMR
jgi:hypothetical protein